MPLGRFSFALNRQPGGGGTDHVLKSAQQESRAFMSRTFVVLLVVALLFAMLIARLVWLTVFKHDEFHTISEDNRIQDIDVAATRGRIYDRHGELLADNRPAFSIVMVPEDVGDVEAALAEIGTLIDLSNGEPEAFHARLARKRRPHSRIPVKLDISPEERAVIEVNRHRLQGIHVTSDTVRHYPFGAVMSHAVGSVRRITEEDLQRLDPNRYTGATQFIGKRGVEAFYEDSLHGRAGLSRVEVDAHGQIYGRGHGDDPDLSEYEPQPGKNIVLHLDSRLQIAAAAALGQRRGAVVAIDPRSGGVLAMVSIPGYDPNLFVTGMDDALYRETTESPTKPLFNRATNGLYAPGSTFKPIVGLAALSAGITDWELTINDTNGEFRLSNQSRAYRDWNWTKSGAGGQGVVDLYRAIYRSSNIYFYHLGAKLDVDALPHFAAQFGFGQVTSLDVADADPGTLPTAEWKAGTQGEPWYPGDNVNLSIGQGYILVTPLQLATAASIIANRGRFVRPRMLLSSDPNLLTRLDVGELPRVTGPTSEDWERLVDAMEDVVHRGNQGYRQNGTAWAYIGRNLSYRMAAKSGTAQVVAIAQDEEYDEEELAEHLRKHAWFVAFAPADEPRIAVAVLVENGGSGSQVAGPVAREVIDAYLLPILAGTRRGPVSTAGTDIAGTGIHAGI